MTANFLKMDYDFVERKSNDFHDFNVFLFYLIRISYKLPINNYIKNVN